MASRSDRRVERRKPLSKEMVLRAAVALADEGGIESLSMRKLARAVGVEAMSLYNHVANKDEILDGIVDLIVGEIDMPTDGVDWKTAMRQRAISAHEVLLRHPWASVLIESRTTPSPVRLRYCDTAIGTLREGGFPTALAFHAFLTMDSYIYGFILQELSWPFDMEEMPAVVATLSPQIPADEFPHIAEMMGFIMESGAASAGGDSVSASEFEFGLDLILDGLERVRDTA